MSEKQKKRLHRPMSGSRGNFEDIVSSRLFDKVFDTFGPAFGFGESTSRIRRMAFSSNFIVSYLGIVERGVLGTVPVAPSFSSVRAKKVRDLLRLQWRRFSRNVGLYDECNLLEFQEAMLRGYLTDGRVFAVVQHHPELEFGFGLVCLPREFLLSNYTDRDARVINGVHYDSAGRVSGYYFCDFTNLSNRELNGMTGPQGLFAAFGSGEMTVDPSQRRFVPVSRVVDFRRCGPHRQVVNYPSPLVPVAAMASILADLDRSTLDALGEVAKRGGFVTTTMETPMPTDTELTAADVITEKEKGSGIELLPSGANFVPYSSGWPATDSLATRKELIRSMAASSGVDYSSLNSDATAVNFSSLRHFALQTRDEYRRLQCMFSDRMMGKVLNQFLEYGVSRSQVGNAAREQAMDSPYEFRQYSWVDPLKDAEMNLKLLRMGAKDPRQLARESGSDFTDNVQAWLDIATDLGVEGETDFAKVQTVMALFSNELVGGIRAGGPAEPESQFGEEQAEPEQSSGDEDEQDA